MTPSEPPFELLRFEAVAVTGAAAVVELDGSFANGTAPARPRLLVERGGATSEVPAVGGGGVAPAAPAGVRAAAPGEAPWSASFAIPVEALGDRDAGFALVPDRGPLIGLPAPTLPDNDRYVRLARNANALRRRAAEASDAAIAAQHRLADAEGERDAAVRERDELRASLTSTTARAEAAEAEAAALREAAERAAREAREASDRALAEARVEAEREMAEPRAEAEREVAEARAEAEREIAEARAEAEREVEAARRSAQAARAEAQAQAASEIADARRAAEEADHDAAEAHDDAERERKRRAELDERVIAAEDEVRHARRELRDARARLEAIGRDDRHRPRGGGAVRASAIDDTAPQPPLGDAADAEPTAPTDAIAAATPPATDEAPDDDDVEHDAPEDEAPTTDGDDADARGGDADDTPSDGDEGELWFTSPRPPEHEGEESVRVLRRGGARPPAIAAARAAPASRPARHRPQPDGDDDVLDPAAVGARLIEPAGTRTPPLGTWPRFMAVGALSLLFLLLVLILLGVL